MISSELLARNVATIGDAIRGSLIVNKPEQITQIVQTVADRVINAGGAYYTKNFWDDSESLSLGYVGVHIKIKMPLPQLKTNKIKEPTSSDGANRQEKYILMELQVHLEEIMNGTKGCAKEIVHRLYKGAPRYEEELLPKLNDSCKLAFLTAMTNVSTSEDAQKPLKNKKFTQSIEKILAADNVNPKKNQAIKSQFLLLQDEALGDADWDEQLQALVPQNGPAIDAAWKKKREDIRKIINLPSEQRREEVGWKNTATTVDELVEDAKKMRGLFMGMCMDIALDNPGCHANFGPEEGGNLQKNCVLKDRASLEAKVLADCAKELRFSMHGSAPCLLIGESKQPPSPSLFSSSSSSFSSSSPPPSSSVSTSPLSITASSLSSPSSSSTSVASSTLIRSASRASRSFQRIRQNVVATKTVLVAFLALFGATECYAFTPTIMETFSMSHWCTPQCEPQDALIVDVEHQLPTIFNTVTRNNPENMQLVISSFNLPFMNSERSNKAVTNWMLTKAVDYRHAEIVCNQQLTTLKREYEGMQQKLLETRLASKDEVLQAKEQVINMLLAWKTETGLHNNRIGQCSTLEETRAEATQFVERLMQLQLDIGGLTADKTNAEKARDQCLKDKTQAEADRNTYLTQKYSEETEKEKYKKERDACETAKSNCWRC